MGQGGWEVGGGRRRLGEDKGGYCFFCFGFVTNRRYICIRIDVRKLNKRHGICWKTVIRICAVLARFDEVREVVVYANLENEALREHIDRVGVRIYVKGGEPSKKAPRRH